VGTSKRCTRWYVFCSQAQKSLKNILKIGLNTFMYMIAEIACINPKDLVIIEDWKF
jgi:hypothetical protein